MVYVKCEVSEYVARAIDDINVHFQRKYMCIYTLLVLEETSSLNGQNECVFRHICENSCYSVFVQIRDAPDENAWKICEVKFD